MYDLNKLNHLMWFNGSIIRMSDFSISPLTHGLHYAGAVFEGIKVVDNRVIGLDAHVRRFFYSAECLYLHMPYSHADIVDAVRSVLSVNSFSNAYVRPLAWRYADTMKINPKNHHADVMVIAWEPFSARPKAPSKAVVSKFIRIHPESMRIDCKSSAHYSMMTVADIEAEKYGGDVALFLDYRGFVAECTGANIFFIRDNKLITPLPDNCLNGITRQRIIVLSAELNILCEERHVTSDEIMLMDAAFVTGTAVGVHQLSSVLYNGILCELAVDHKIYQLLHETYKQKPDES